ncbi:MAG: nucleotidyltransferase family protein, partial [Fibrobacter sp.]|nr:nucleotidyltransferase family protein [Fibrobacter sp.]
MIPSAGVGSRIQPLAFSKELLPVGSCRVGSLERPRAISEYLIERMVLAGVKNICMVIGPSKADIIKYYSSIFNDVFFTFIVQNIPRGLCDAIFKALPLLNSDDSVIVGLPDTLWFPADALCQLTSDHLSFLLFPVDHPENYDAVEIDEYGFVNHIHVKKSGVTQRWVWGAFKLPVTV